MPVAFVSSLKRIKAVEYKGSVSLVKLLYVERMASRAGNVLFVNATSHALDALTRIFL